MRYSNESLQYQSSHKICSHPVKFKTVITPTHGFSNLVTRPHPAHMRRSGPMSQIQMLGLAPEAWSDQ